MDGSDSSLLDSSFLSDPDESSGRRSSEDLDHDGQARARVSFSDFFSYLDHDGPAADTLSMDMYELSDRKHQPPQPASLSTAVNAEGFIR